MGGHTPLLTVDETFRLCFAGGEGVVTRVISLPLERVTRIGEATGANIVEGAVALVEVADVRFGGMLVSRAVR